MIAENPLALSFILPGDVYMLAGEKTALMMDEPAVYPEPIATEVPVVSEPEITKTEPAVQPIATAAPEPVAVIPAIPSIPKPAAETPSPPAEFKYKGGNQKRFLVIVHYPGQDLMEPAHLTALENAITRRGLSLDDTAIFNIAQYPGTPLKAIGAFFKPQKMLLLGSDSFPSGLDAYNLTLNQPGKVGKCDALYSYSFGEMMGNNENKKAFWEQMKSL